MSEDFTPQSASYNLGRAVGWSAYEEFLKEYASAYPELENAEPGRRLSDYVPEPVYLRAITFGVSKYLNLPTGTNAWNIEEGDEGTDYTPHLLTQIVECRGANWGCTPIIGLNYSSAQVVEDIAKRRKLEKAISSIFSCESVNSEGVPVSSTNRLGGYLKFYASPELKDTSIEMLPLIVRGLDVDALITEHPNEDICWGPQGLLFGGNGLTGGKTQEVVAERKILSTALPQLYKSSPYVDFQSSSPKSSYPNEDPSSPSSWAYSGQVNYDTVKKEIELRSVDIPEGTSYLSTVITIPHQFVKDTHDNDVFRAPPSLYGSRSYADDFKGLEFAKEYVVPFDTAAPYHIRIMPHDHNISPDMYYEYQGLYCKNVVVLHETEGDAPSYIFQQLYEHDGDVKVIPVSDDTLVGIQNTIQASFATYPMVATLINNPGGDFWNYEDHNVIANLELRGALSLTFAQEYAFDPYPEGYPEEEYTTASQRSADLNTLNRLFTWHDANNNRVNKAIWDAMVADNPARVADYRWIIINPNQSFDAPHYSYLVPIDKKTGRFRFVQKAHAEKNAPAWFVIRTHRYGLGKVIVEDNNERYEFLYADDTRYYAGSDGKITSTSMTAKNENAIIGYVIFNTGSIKICDTTRTYERSWNALTGEWVTSSTPLSSPWNTLVNNNANLEVLYESIHAPHLSPRLDYAYNSDTYTFTAKPVVPEHQILHPDPNNNSEQTVSVTIRAWTAAERNIFEKAVKGINEATSGWRGFPFSSPGSDEDEVIYPDSFITEWWNNGKVGPIEAENNMALEQYISKKQGVQSVVVDGLRHRPTLNDALADYLNLPEEAWETAMETLTLKDFLMQGCGFSLADYNDWKEEIFPGAAPGVENMKLAQLMLNTFYRDLDEPVTGSLPETSGLNLNFVILSHDSAASSIAYRPSIGDTTVLVPSDDPTGPHDMVSAPPKSLSGDPTDNGQWVKVVNIPFGLSDVTAADCWIVTANFPEAAPMRPCLIEVDPEFQKPGGVQAAIGKSGLHETWSLALTDYNGALFPTSGTAGLIPDPEDTSTITTWDDTITWTVLLEALGNNKRIDILGEALRHLKSVIKDAGSDEHGGFYITLHNEKRIYFSSQAPDSANIPDGSIGIGW